MSTKRGNGAFGHRGFVYILDRMAADKVIKLWRCERRDRCPARFHTAGGEVVKTVNEHSHDNNLARIVARQAVTEMKRRAANTVEGTAHIVNRTFQNVPQFRSRNYATASRFEENDQTSPIRNRPSSRGVRKFANSVDTRKLQILSTFSGNIGIKYLFSDSGPGGASRILIFGRTQNL